MDTAIYCTEMGGVWTPGYFVDGTFLVCNIKISYN